MQDYVIFTDSSADLNAELVRELEVEVLPLSVIIGGKSFHNYPDNRELDPHDFYEQMRGGAMPTTSALNVGQVTEAVEPILQGGRDVLFLAFSSGLSATYSAVQMAAEELSEKHPGRKFLVVDTLCASMGQGLIVYHAVQQKRAGKSIEEVRDWVEAHKLNVCHWVTVDDLMHLKRGGRVSAATALVGTMLSIKPIIHVDNKGCLDTVGKSRGRKTALLTLVDRMAERATDPEHDIVFISHGDCLEDAKFVADEARKRLGTPEFRFNHVGPVIGAHTGPGVIALCFMGKER